MDPQQLEYALWQTQHQLQHAGTMNAGLLTVIFMMVVMTIMILVAFRTIHNTQERRIKYLEDDRIATRREGHDRQAILHHRINELWLMHSECQRRETKLQSELEQLRKKMP